MTINRQRKKSVEMIQKIEQDILSGKLKGGDKISSIRELMELFSISKGTVERGIDELCQRGFLEKRVGSGTFVISGQILTGNITPGAITVFCPRYGGFLGNEVSMFAHILRGILEMARECHWELNSICCLGEDPMRIKREQIDYANSCSSGIIFVGEYDTSNKDLDLRVPAVGTFMCSNFGNRMSLINPDIWDAAEKACEYFTKCGKTHVAVISNRVPIYDYRTQIFKFMWESSGNTVEEVFVDEPHGKILMDSKKSYFFASDSLAQQSLEYTLQNTGIKVHECGCLCAIDGKKVCDPSFFSFPTYVVDWHNLGRFLFEELLFRINHLGTPARRINVAGRFLNPYK